MKTITINIPTSHEEVEFEKISDKHIRATFGNYDGYGIDKSEAFHDLIDNMPYENDALKTENEATSDKVYYAIVWETNGEPEFTNIYEDGNPVLYLTAKSAWKEIADYMVAQLEQFIKGRRELEDTDFATEMDVVPVKIRNGKILSESRNYSVVHQIMNGAKINFQE